MKAMGQLKRGQDPHSLWDGEHTTSGHEEASDTAFAVRLVDESCAASGLHTGNTVIVDPSVEYRPRDFVVAVREDLQLAVFGHFAKPLVGAGYPFQVTPDDPHFSTYEFDEAHPGFVVGRATKQIRDL